MSIYVVLPWQIVQQLEQRPIQGDQTLFRVSHYTFSNQKKKKKKNNNVTVAGEEGEAMYFHQDYWNCPLSTANTHARSTTLNWRRLGLDDTKRSLSIWIYRLLWTIPATTVTTRRCLLWLINRKIHLWDVTKRMFKNFNKTDLRDYQNFYLLTNVLFFTCECVQEF